MTYDPFQSNFMVMLAANGGQLFTEGYSPAEYKPETNAGREFIIHEKQQFKIRQQKANERRAFWADIAHRGMKRQRLMALIKLTSIFTNDEIIAIAERALIINTPLEQETIDKLQSIIPADEWEQAKIRLLIH